MIFLIRNSSDTCLSSMMTCVICTRSSREGYMRHNIVNIYTRSSSVLLPKGTARPQHGLVKLGRAFAAMRCSRRAPASIAGSGTVGHNILARVPTKLQHADMLSGRSRRGARRHGRGRAVTLPQLSAIFFGSWPNSNSNSFANLKGKFE